MANRSGRWLCALAFGLLPVAGASGQVCAPATAIQRVNFAGADTTLALPSQYFASGATVTAGDRALQFEADTDTLSGFLLDVPVAAGGSDARSQADAVIARFTAGAATLGATTVTTADAGRVILTHDRFNAVASIRINVVLSAVAGRRDLRNRATAVSGNHLLADFTGLATGGPLATGYSVVMSVLIRPGTPNRLRVLGVVGSTVAIDDDAQTVGIAADDIVDGVPLARANVIDVPVCDQETTSDAGSADVDLLISTYTGGTLDALRPTAAATAGAIYDALIAAGADLRVGVVPHSNNDRDLGTGNGGVLRSGFQRNRAQVLTDISNVAGTSGCNWVLTAADNAIVRALPRTAPGADSTTKLRANATLVVLYIDGEHAQEIESGVCGQGALGTGQTDTARAAPNVAQQTTINTIVAPFVNRLTTNGAQAYGLLQALVTPFCAGLTEDGRGYAEVIAGTAGASSRVCDAGAANVSAAIVASLPLVVPYDLVEPPIAASLRVRVVPGGSGTPIEVPRSRSDGFDLDRSRNAVVITGDTFQPAIGDRVDVSYEQWPSTIFTDGFE